MESNLKIEYYFDGFTSIPLLVIKYNILKLLHEWIKYSICC
ncbi:hypothetical protein NARC_10091 [Candidatus Nitrosocosmicus arcticus]|uniref:Uncharacterized protein n=1 Tax=Candidatus Nitrosocosmicus arcticus TaxID=2035267 RepID=A0A557SYK3_9ARCH|nr:hypothetical protein NARC_10091 [Candidatus Nitrosocosmicus arcticus]